MEGVVQTIELLTPYLGGSCGKSRTTPVSKREDTATPEHVSKMEPLQRKPQRKTKRSWGKYPNQSVRTRAEHIWGGSSLVSRTRPSAGREVHVTNALPPQKGVWKGPAAETEAWVGESLHTPSPVGTLEYWCKYRCTVTLGPVVLEHNAHTDTRIDLPALCASCDKGG